jgi:hypothetical protein
MASLFVVERGGGPGLANMAPLCATARAAREVLHIASQEASPARI